MEVGFEISRMLIGDLEMFRTYVSKGWGDSGMGDSSLISSRRCVDEFGVSRSTFLAFVSVYRLPEHISKSVMFHFDLTLLYFLLIFGVWTGIYMGLAIYNVSKISARFVDPLT